MTSAHEQRTHLIEWFIQDMIINRRTLLSRQESIDGRLKHACTTGLAVRRREAHDWAKQRERERERDNRGRVAVEKGEERKPIEAERGNEIETNASRKSLYPSLLSSPLLSSPLSGNFLPPPAAKTRTGSSRCRSQPPARFRERNEIAGLNHGKQKRNKRK